MLTCFNLLAPTQCSTTYSPHCHSVWSPTLVLPKTVCLHVMPPIYNCDSTYSGITSRGQFPAEWNTVLLWANISIPHYSMLLISHNSLFWQSVIRKHFSYLMAQHCYFILRIGSQWTLSAAWTQHWPHTLITTKFAYNSTCASTVI